MKGQELVGEAAAKMLDTIEENDAENEEVVASLICVVIHIDDGSKDGASYIRFRSSNPSWIYQLGLAQALAEHVRTSSPIPDEDDEDEIEDTDDEQAS